MIKGTITYYDGRSTAITIGSAEDIKAPRQLDALRKAGWPVDEQFTLTFKAFLAGKRQGDIPTDTQFETWVDGVEEVDLKPTEKQIREAVALGRMKQKDADALLTLLAEDAGEAPAPPA